MVWLLAHPGRRDWPGDAEVMAVMYGRNGRCGRFPRHAVVGTALSLPLGEKHRIPGCSGRCSGAPSFRPPLAKGWRRIHYILILPCPVIRPWRIASVMAMLRKLTAQEHRSSYPGRTKMLITKSATAQAAAIPVVSFTTSHHSGRL